MWNSPPRLNCNIFFQSSISIEIRRKRFVELNLTSVTNSQFCQQVISCTYLLATPPVVTKVSVIFGSFLDMTWNFITLICSFHGDWMILFFIDISEDNISRSFISGKWFLAFFYSYVLDIRISLIFDSDIFHSPLSPLILQTLFYFCKTNCLLSSSLVSILPWPHAPATGHNLSEMGRWWKSLPPLEASLPIVPPPWLLTELE